ncbi:MULTISPECIES: virulence RhuM family protein [unclassified Maridesulfovibrio]|uniref:virulence RhuM family protein n=1 Tax=unclassified Maridesulfovibrio TaxID=2794999 RepID=UPI003B3F5BEB
MSDILAVSNSSIDIFNSADGSIKVQVRFGEETVWMSQRSMADLFGVTVSSINQHLKNIFDEEELIKESVIKKFLITASDGKNYETSHFNLDVVISVGYRVRSNIGIQFRRWATERLREYMIKGFTMDDDRLKNPGGFDYFDELIERIREIRASEKRFYQKVKDIFSQTSSDYDGKSETARMFFKTIQNKMLFATTGKTAAEIIKDRADSALPNMGLTSFQGSVVRIKDIVTSKNYLSKDELSELDRLVVMFLDFAEDRARRRKTISMQDWIKQTDLFLEFNEREVLSGAGSVSHEQAKVHARSEYDLFDTQRRDKEYEISEDEAEKDFEELLKSIEK